MRKRFVSAVLALIMCFSSLIGCQKRLEPVEVESTTFAMDTVIHFTAYGWDERETRQQLDRLTDDLNTLDKLMSVTREDSGISWVNQSNGRPMKLEEYPGLVTPLYLTLELCQVTGGVLDITAYPAVKAWGFTTGEHRVPEPDELAELAKRIDYTAVKMGGESQKGSDIPATEEEMWAGYDYILKRETVTLPEGVEIDLGAVAKGYAGDLLAAYVRANENVFSALLDLGQSTIMAVGSKPEGKPWRIGVVDPAQPENYFAVVELADMAMGTSGGYQRYFEQDGITYWHILDPDTAAPARSGLASVTVVSPSALACDGLSTALFVMGLEKGTQFWRDHPELEFDAIFVTEEGEIYRTAGLEGRFSLAEGYTDREVTVLE